MIASWRRWRERRRTLALRKDLRPLVALTHRFLAGELDAATYDERYRRAYLLGGPGPEAARVVDRLLAACEDYVDDPALRDEPGDVGPEELRAAARRALDELGAIDPSLVALSSRPRREILHDLLEMAGETPDLADELRVLPWDSEELVTLEPRHLTRLLDRHRVGALRDDEVTAWAEAVEMRDDIGRRPGCSDLLDEVLFVLADPTVNGPLSAELLARLRRADGSR